MTCPQHGTNREGIRSCLSWKPVLRFPFLSSNPLIHLKCGSSHQCPCHLWGLELYHPAHMEPGLNTFSDSAASSNLREPLPPAPSPHPSACPSSLYLITRCRVPQGPHLKGGRCRAVEMMRWLERLALPHAAKLEPSFWSG